MITKIVWRPAYLCPKRTIMAIKVNKKNFQAVVLKSNKPVVVDVWADWCGPCHVLTPHFEAASEELKGKVRFVKLDAEKNQKLTKQLQVMNLPTLLYFKDGKLVDRNVGVVSKAAILSRLRPLLDKEDRPEKGGSWWQFWK